MHNTRGLDSRVDGRVRTSWPSEGGFVAQCAQRVASAVDDDERSGRYTHLPANVQRLGCDFKSCVKTNKQGPQLSVNVVARLAFSPIVLFL